jgi:hypothetical protein
MSADININDTFSSYEELLVFKGNYEKYNFIQLYTRISFNYTQEHHKLWITSLREILPEKHQ